MRAHVAAAASLLAGGVAMAAILHVAPTAIGGILPASERTAETLFVLLLYGSFILVAGTAGLALHHNAFALGRSPATSFLLGAALGLGGITLATGYAALAGALAWQPAAAAPLALLWGALLVLFQAAAEEIYFRGWIQPAVARAWGHPAAIALTAALFAALHLLGGAAAPLSLVNLLLGGMLFGVLAARRGGLAGAIGAHFAWNAAEQLLFGLDPNTGNGPFGAVFDADLAGTAHWGGSGEGLNASLAMAMALLVLLVPLLILAAKRTTTPPL